MSTTVSILSSHVIQSTTLFSPVKSLGLQETKYLYVQPLARGASSTAFFLGRTLFSLDECLSSSFLGLDGVEGGLL
ncbi:hypothetical protein Hanom_Chr09g00850341 [Helianthus anomalus]